MKEGIDATLERKTNSVIKVVLVGSGGVGKTCIVSRLVTGDFVDAKMTVGLNIDAWTIKDAEWNSIHQFVSMDLGGQEQFRFLHQEFLKGSSIIIAVFDVSRYESLIELEEWRGIIEDTPNTCCVLVGNKMDIPSMIEPDEIERIEREWNTRCIQISTVTGKNFELLEHAILDSLKRIEQMNIQLA